MDRIPDIQHKISHYLLYAFYVTHTVHFLTSNILTNKMHKVKSNETKTIKNPPLV